MSSRIALGVFLSVLALGIGVFAATSLGQSGRRVPAQTRQQQSAQPAAAAEDNTPSMSNDDVASPSVAAAPASAPVGHAPSPSTVTSAATPIAWRSSFSAAKSAAKPGQVIFVDVYTDWCGWCKYMDQRVYTDKGVQRFAADQLFVKLDAEDNGEGTAFARSVGVRGFPTLLVYTSDGKLLAAQPGAFRRPDDFLSWLQSASSHH